MEITEIILKNYNGHNVSYILPADATVNVYVGKNIKDQPIPINWEEAKIISLTIDVFVENENEDEIEERVE